MGSTAKELSEQLADLALGFFGGVHSSEQDRADLATSLTDHCVNWVNERFELGLK